MKEENNISSSCSLAATKVGDAATSAIVCATDRIICSCVHGYIFKVTKTQQQPLPGVQQFLSSFAGFSAYTVILAMRISRFLYVAISSTLR